jgi:hypothetical protein
MKAMLLFFPCLMLAVGAMGADVLNFPPLAFASEGAHKILLFEPGGGIAWEYSAEMSRDVWCLTNGNVLFSYNDQYDSAKNDNPSGVMEITRDKRVAFHFQTTGQVWSCQRQADGNTLVGAASQGRLLIVNPQGTVVRTIVLRGAPGHSCIRNARQLASGNYLVAEEGSHAVREYSPAGELVRETKVSFPPYSAVRLANGHTIACGSRTMVELDADAKIVWTLADTDLPQLGVRWFAGIQVLPNGNIFVCNAGGKVPFFELDRQRKVAWQSGTNGFAIGHGIQRLDVAGVPVK